MVVTLQEISKEFRLIILSLNYKKVSQIYFKSFIGHDYIMTFRDTSVLIADDNNEEVLENIEL
jgi:hypothetical protein